MSKASIHAGYKRMRDEAIIRKTNAFEVIMRMICIATPYSLRAIIKKGAVRGSTPFLF